MGMFCEKHLAKLYGGSWIKILTLAVLVYVAPISIGNAQSNVRPELETFAVIGVLDGGEGFCSNFTIPRKKIEKYLKTMRSSPARYYADDLYSPCKIEGTFRYTNGDEGRFVIQSSGMGLLDTNMKGLRTVFSQPDWNDPNAGTYFNAD